MHILAGSSFPSVSKGDIEENDNKIPAPMLSFAHPDGGATGEDKDRSGESRSGVSAADLTSLAVPTQIFDSEKSDKEDSTTINTSKG